MTAVSETPSGSCDDVANGVLLINHFLPPLLLISPFCRNHRHCTALSLHHGRWSVPSSAKVLRERDREKSRNEVEVPGVLEVILWHSYSRIRKDYYNKMI